jgi:hypothetical protein
VPFGRRRSIICRREPLPIQLPVLTPWRHLTNFLAVVAVATPSPPQTQIAFFSLPMENHPTSPLRRVSLPTFASSVPLEIATLPASTRTSFTRVENNTRPGTAAGDNHDMGDEALPGDPPTPQSGNEPEEGVEAAAAAATVVPQVPQALVQLLLVSGRRRSMAFDPETTVGRVKEFAWNTWPTGTCHTLLPSFPSLPFPPSSPPLTLMRTQHTHLPLLFSTGPRPARSRLLVLFISSVYGREFCHFEYGP